MKDKKLFAIYICTYNGEKTIRECIEYILKLKDLNEYVQEVVVVDNNSDDTTKQIVESLQKTNPIIHYEFELRQGLSFARHHAINSSAEWIIYVDDDNFLTLNWLNELYNTIIENPDVGVINGSIIARPGENFNEMDLNCLKVLYRNLACTSLWEEDVVKENNSPVGAGLCVKNAGLKEIDRAGWIHLIGRKGNELLSGEDGELCSRMFDLGYRYFFNYKMKLYHLIPQQRVQYEYVNRLLDGLVLGSIQQLKTRKLSRLRLMLRRIKYVIRKKKLAVVKEPEIVGSIEWWKYTINKIIANSYTSQVNYYITH